VNHDASRQSAAGGRGSTGHCKKGNVAWNRERKKSFRLGKRSVFCSSLRNAGSCWPLIRGTGGPALTPMVKRDIERKERQLPPLYLEETKGKEGREPFSRDRIRKQRKEKGFRGKGEQTQLQKIESGETRRRERIPANRERLQSVKQTLPEGCPVDMKPPSRNIREIFMADSMHQRGGTCQLLGEKLIIIIPDAWRKRRQSDEKKVQYKGREKSDSPWLRVSGCLKKSGRRPLSVAGKAVLNFITWWKGETPISWQILGSYPRLRPKGLGSPASVGDPHQEGFGRTQVEGKRRVQKQV